MGIPQYEPGTPEADAFQARSNELSAYFRVKSWTADEIMHLALATVFQLSVENRKTAIEWTRETLHMIEGFPS